MPPTTPSLADYLRRRRHEIEKAFRDLFESQDGHLAPTFHFVRYPNESPDAVVVVEGDFADPAVRDRAAAQARRVAKAIRPAMVAFASEAWVRTGDTPEAAQAAAPREVLVLSFESVLGRETVYIPIHRMRPGDDSPGFLDPTQRESLQNLPAEGRFAHLLDERLD